MSARTSPTRSASAASAGGAGQARRKSCWRWWICRGFADRPVSKLSGGQRQRVAIARALALSPKLFLLDEPLSALDAKLREAMQVELRQLQQRLGITTIVVTHDQREAMTMADLVVVMGNGRIQQAASPVEIYRRPANSFVADFIGSTNLLPVRPTARAGAVVPGGTIPGAGACRPAGQGHPLGPAGGCASRGGRSGAADPGTHQLRARSGRQHRNLRGCRRHPASSRWPRRASAPDFQVGHTVGVVLAARSLPGAGIVRRGAARGGSPTTRRWPSRR